MINTIYWIRHGQSVANTHKYLHPIYLDPPLTELGQSQILDASHALNASDVDIILCSPLIRSIESGKIIQGYLKCHTEKHPKLIILNSLVEKGIGLDNIAVHSLINCTKPTNLINRIMGKSPYKSFLEELREICKKYRNIVIVGHENINNEYIRKLCNIDITPMKNGEIIMLTMSNFRIVSVENYLRKYRL